MSDTTSLSTVKVDPLSQMMGFRTVSIKELPSEDKKVLLDTVARGANDSELAFFLNVALAQELNPFTREVWLIKYGDKLTIQTGRDGYLKIAKRDPTFDRIQSAEVREGDSFTMDPVSGQIEHRIGMKRGNILGAWALITRKDGTKIAKFVSFSEYNDGASSTWKDYPSAMICKSSESAVCKQFANISGIIAEELIRRDGSVIDTSPTAQAQQSSLKDDLIKQIEACQTMPDFVTLRDTIAGTVGKLFGPEKEAVYAAAKAKKAELEARPDMSGKVVNHKNGDAHNNEVSNLEIVDAPHAQTSTLPAESHGEVTGMSQEELESWLEGLRMQETQTGVDDVLKATADKQMSDTQRAILAEAAKAAKVALEPKKPSKKKPSPTAE